jgi:ribosomal protein S12 methylthiotransferase accessory factor
VPAPTAPSLTVFRSGTHRVRLPEETWDVIVPKFPRFGITRIADVTGLDTAGIPVAMAVRPLARSLSVAQGKGQTTVLAKVSAAMESLEHWHAEQAPPAVVARHVPGGELNLPYRVSELDTLPGALVGDRTPLDWVAATGLAGGGDTMVPLDLVCLTRPDRWRWMPAGFNRSSNGLASGNSLPEAALHALYEVVERDALRTREDDGRSRGVDPDTVHDPGCAAMLARLRAAGLVFGIEHVANRFAVPCFSAWIWSEDLPVTCLGFGAHLAPEVALSRAVTEAAQSRLTAIVGSREDLPPVYHHVRHGADERPSAVSATASWAEIIEGSGGGGAGPADDLAAVSATVAEVIGYEPLLVDLSTDADFAVVKIIVPGTGSDLHRFHAPG